MAYQSKSEYSFLVDFVLLRLDIIALFVLHAAPLEPLLSCGFLIYKHSAPTEQKAFFQCDAPTQQKAFTGCRKG